jgi:1,4-alpha-glucan branching enzyme
MIKKEQKANDGLVPVTFELPASIWAGRVSLVGEFNDRDAAATPMVLNQSSAKWQATIELQPGRCYRFRYLVDGKTWFNDWQTNGHVRNSDGSHDSVVDLTVPAGSPDSQAVCCHSTGLFTM